MGKYLLETLLSVPLGVLLYPEVGLLGLSSSKLAVSPAALGAAWSLTSLSGEGSPVHLRKRVLFF